MLGLLLASASPTQAAFPSPVDPPLHWKFMPPDAKPCDPEIDLRGGDLYVIHAEWMRLGGPNGPLGCPTPVQRHPSGLVEVRFENGTIVANPNIWEHGVLAAYQDWDHIVVDWAIDGVEGPGPGGPYGLYFHKFLVLWKQVGSPSAEQIDVWADGNMASMLGGGKYMEETHLWTKGHVRLNPKYSQRGPTTYTVEVKGCDQEALGSDCPLDWLGPATVAMTWPAPLLNQFGAVDLRGLHLPETVAASRATFHQRASRAILQGACGQVLPWSNFHNESGSAFIALAKMAYAEVFQTDRCPGRDVENRKEVAQWLQRQRVESASGTTIDGIAGILRTGEYDTALTGWVALLYAFGHELPRPVAEHVLLGLLNKRGPVDESDHSVTVFGVPETENHILMIESSRYLTNQLLCEHGFESPSVCDNEANGMNRWMLGHLRRFLAEDFIEYHSNPYQDYTLTALMNLYSYARDERVKAAAQMVLDYVFLKAAASSDELRRAVPFRRKRSYEDKLFFSGPHTDPMVGFLLQLAGPVRWLGDWGRQGFAWEGVWAAVSEYRIPPLILDVILNRESRSFYQRFYHHTIEIYFGSPGYTISAGGTPTPHAYRFVAWTEDDDLGIAVPTLLLPADRAGTSREEAVRFAIDNGEAGDGNVCVAPNFACGSRLEELPKEYQGISRTEGAWTFVNDARPTGILAGPPEGARRAEDALADVFSRHAPLRPAVGKLHLGYYLALYRGQGVALLEAYDLALEGNSLTFDQFVAGVKERNGTSSFTTATINRYVTTDGTVVEFQVSDSRNGFAPSIVSVNGSQPTAAFASGTIADSEGQTAFLRIRSPSPKSMFAECELVLDHRDVARPKRELGGPVICETGEQVGTFEDYKPCDPVVFVPAPDAPSERLSQAWGDSGIWDRDRINVRLQEVPAGSGQFQVGAREEAAPSAIEVSAENVRLSETLTRPYQGPKYAGATGPTADNPEIAAAEPAFARGEPSPAGATITRPDRIDSVGVFGRSRAESSPITDLPSSKQVEWGFQQSFGLSLDQGIRLEVDVLCDERLSPRVYGLRYLRFGGSGELLVDVMLKFSQPPPR